MDTDTDVRRADESTEGGSPMEGSRKVRNAAGWLFVPLILLTLFAGAAWLNNVGAAKARNHHIAQKRSEYEKKVAEAEKRQRELEDMRRKGLEVPEEPAQKDPAEAMAQPNGLTRRTRYSGWFGSEWLDSLAVDFSTFSTFIPFFGLIFITWGLRTINRGSRKKRVTEHFPFFSKYITITVTMGFVGTVWGLINVFSDPTVSLSNVAMCLDTALYSTLVGLVWSFFIALPISFGMVWMYKQAWPGHMTKQKDFVQLFTALAAAVTKAVERLEAIVEAGTGFEGFVGGVTEELGKLKGTLGNMSGDIKGFFRVGTDTMEKMGEESKTRNESSGVQLRILQGMETRQNNETKKLQKQLTERDQQLAAEREAREKAERERAAAIAEKTEAARQKAEAARVLETEKKARKDAETRAARLSGEKATAVAHAGELEGKLASIQGIAATK